MITGENLMGLAAALEDRGLKGILIRVIKDMMPKLTKPLEMMLAKGVG